MSNRFKTNGAKRKIDNSNKRAEVAIGYCNYNLHKGYVTIPAIQHHKCVEKQCPHFTLFEEKYWIDRQAKHILKRLRKARNKQGITQEDYACYEAQYKTSPKSFVKRFIGTNYFWEDDYCVINRKKNVI